MLKIQRSINAGNVRFALSGRIESEHLAELQRLIDEDAQRKRDHARPRGSTARRPRGRRLSGPLRSERASG